jgi:type VI secretion system Hcp family effector
MKIDGDVQGVFPGCSTRSQVVGQTEVALLKQEDRASSVNTEAATLVVVAEICKQSPSVLRAMATNESLTVTISWWKTTPQGTITKYYESKFENANVTAIRHLRSSGLLEEVEFSYSKLTETYVPQAAQSTATVNGMTQVTATPGWPEYASVTPQLLGQDPYMAISGQQQGAIPGCSTISSLGRSGQIPLDLFREEGSRVGGPSTIGPVTVVMDICSQSPHLLSALETNEELTVTTNWFDANQAGIQFIFYRVTLEHANVVSIRHIHTTFTDREEVTFTYTKLTETYVPTNDDAVVDVGP